MKISETGLKLIKSFEGLRLDSYRCPAGVLTIGFGHTGSDVKSNMHITKDKAEQLLLGDLKRFESNVNKYVSTYKFNQNQYDALVSFAYNIGSIDGLVANGKRSIQQIASNMLLYNKAGGKVLAGLDNRRKKEHELFTKGGSNKYKVTTGLNIRKKADSNSYIVGSYEVGAVIQIEKVNSNKKWGKTNKGWVCLKYCKKI